MEKTIKDAIVYVLKSEGKALSPQLIYQKIKDSGLYVFKAKSPVHVVTTVLRQHTDGVEIKRSSVERCFRVKAGEYSLLEKTQD